MSRRSRDQFPSDGYQDALSVLIRLGYGVVSARGLLALADKVGTYIDGNTVIRRNGSYGYRIESR